VADVVVCKSVDAGGVGFGDSKWDLKQQEEGNKLHEGGREGGREALVTGYSYGPDLSGG